MIRFGYTIAYVENVDTELKFFEGAFGLKRRFLNPTGDYGELDTGDTVLAFADHTLGAANFPGGYQSAAPGGKPLGMEIALVTDDVAAAHNAAIQNGATEFKGLEEKPWGQTVSFVVTPSGLTLELCTPIEM